MPLFYAKSLGGILEFSNKREVFDFLLSNSDWKGEYLVTIEKARGKRSLNQNSWYWGVVLKTISEYNGDTADDLHEYFIRTLLPPKFKTVLGKEIKVPSSTSDLNKVQFGEYIERIRAAVAEFGVIIPDPVVQGEMPEYPKEESNITAF